MMDQFGITSMSLRCLTSAIVAVLFQAMPSMAQNTIDGFEGRTYKNSGHTMPYRLFIPKGYDPSKKYPLVLWLHGSGSVGNDNRKQISSASTLGTHTWTRSENQAKYPAFILAPQCPSGKAWTSPGELTTVLEILAAVQKEFSIDSQRLYVAGQSMGGYGTWALIALRPNMFAAAIPLCGGGHVADAPRIAKIPIWAFHGEADPTVSVWESRKMIEAIKKVGGKPRYSEYPGVRHEVWERTFKEPGLLDWVFAQHL
jgi:predicted peptidase